jgi:RNA polymerase sigma-70 factor (sigma-E family)
MGGRVTRGDTTGFDRMVQARSAALLRMAYLLTGDAHAAEDLLQAALTTTYLHWGGLRDEQAGEAYVRTVLVRTHLRWRRRRWRSELPTAEPQGTAADDPYRAADDRDRLRRALARLTARQRACVVLRYYADVSEAEVADMLGIAPGTVKSTTARALERLREEYADPTEAVR